jgi:hypothetical protein
MVVRERLEADSVGDGAREADPALVDRRGCGDVEVEERGDLGSRRRVGDPVVGIEPLEIGEAPVLVARRRQREGLVGLEQLSPHGARTSGAA